MTGTARRGYRIGSEVLKLPRLTVIQGVDEGMQFEVRAEGVTLGRSAACTIRLIDADVASKHVELRALDDGNEFEIENVSAGRIVLVNGQPIQTARLRSGDQIQIGGSILGYISANAQPVAGPQLSSLPVVTRHGDDLPSRIVRTMPVELANASTTNLSILCDAIQAATQILDTEELAAQVLELLFRAVPADRGCILLRESCDAPLSPLSVRHRDGTTSRASIAISRTIVDYVLQSQQGVLVTDAERDARFRTGASVVRLGIREAICVPLTGRHETLGVLYFDILRVGCDEHLTESELSLALAVARQAAIAVEDTRHFQARLQSERLAAIGHAMAALSHHIKNILQGMQSGNDVIQLGIAEADLNLISSGWNLLEKNHRRIRDLVLDMLSYAKERTPACEPCSLSQIVADALRLCRQQFDERGIRVTVDADEVATTLVESESIHRVVLNLVGNAIDATADAHNPEIGVRVYAEPDEPFFCIAVRDNGSGLAHEHLPKLFQPFESTKGIRGTGLGLAVSRKIAREHGGDIVVNNNPGRGCEFILRLPRRDAA